MRLYVQSLRLKLRQKGEMFWGLLLPVILATLFYVSFGSGIDVEQMSAVPAVLVSEGNAAFEAYLEAMDGERIVLTRMDREDALESLKNGSAAGVFYSTEEPSLTVGGESVKTDAGYFYALIGMACLFGTFQGMYASVGLRADQSPLAVRRSITPVHRLTLAAVEMLSAFTVQFLCICALLLYLWLPGIPLGGKWWMLLPVCVLGSMTGVAFGVFVGCTKLREGAKVAVLISSSLAMSFLAGLMFVNMKDIVERYAPFLNRINPAALISDAFYSISIYENLERYRRNLPLLLLMTMLLSGISFLRLRRERYGSL